MLREQGQHVIEKWNAGFDHRFSGSIDVEFDIDSRFVGGALDLRVPRFHTPLSYTNK
jgi:hypothetical protein